jgi:hypothetical protein
MPRLKIESLSGTMSDTHLFLGFLFRAQPTLMTLEGSAKIMDEIFASGEPDHQGRLLKIMQDFLLSVAARHTATQRGAIPPICINQLFQFANQGLINASPKLSV